MLQSCPKCGIDAWDALHDDGSHDYEWYCKSCGHYCDQWWCLEDLTWHTEFFDDTDPSEWGPPRPDVNDATEYPFDIYETKMPEAEIDGTNCVYCDRAYDCKCTEDQYVTGFMLHERLRWLGLHEWDIYELTDQATMADTCYSCEHYMTWSCIPLRNVYRFVTDSQLGDDFPTLVQCMKYRPEITYEEIDVN